MNALRRTVVFDSYWRFAGERLAMYYRRFEDPHGPWTNDPILREYRFTNTFRAADRVSQYLIGEVQYGDGRSQAPAEVFFRTLLFKMFNKIETWEALERELGPISWQSANFEAMSDVLDRQMAEGQRVYSAAYIMPAPAFGHARKHANHLALLAKMMSDGLPGSISRAKGMVDVYRGILEYPGIGPFLAFQYAIDINYSTLTDFDEGDFVVAGPGALDGISKCFENGASLDPARLIYEVTDRQDEEFERLGVDFEGLFGRRLQPIDCQNLFCEISKYSRVAHPEVSGASGRTRIKQRYQGARFGTSAAPTFPPKWGLEPRVPEARFDGRVEPTQLSLF